MRVSLDTSLLVYAEGVNGAARQSAALHVFSLLPGRLTVVPVQVLAELFNVLVRKSGYTRTEARRATLAWRADYAVVDTSVASLLAATDLATIHQLSIWDALVLAVTADARCQLLLSEDLHEGFAWQGVTVVNPFAPTWHPLLEVALGSPKPPPNGIIAEE